MSEQLSTWQIAVRIARFRPGLFALSFLQLTAWSASMLLIGWLLQQVFDALSGARPAGFGIFELVAVLAAAELARIAVMWGGVVRTHAWERMRGLLRLNLLRAQLHSGGPQAGTPASSPGEAVSRFRDDTDDFLNFVQTALTTGSKVVTAVGSMVIMLSIQPVLALVVVLPLVTVVLVTRLVSSRIRTLRVAYRQATAAVTGLLGELFGAVLAVKSGHAGNELQRHLARLNEHRRRTGLKDQLLSQLLSSFNRATVDLSIGVVLLLAAPAMHRGDFTVGDLALFVSYIGSLVWVPYYAGQLISRHRQAGVAIERMAKLAPDKSSLVVHRPLDETERQASVLHPAFESLTVDALGAVHETSGRGFDAVSFALERGTFTVVTGPAGAGKSSLLRAILGLLPVQSGTISWNDRPIDDLAAFLVPPRAAYVPQVPRLFSETLRDNVLLGHHADDLEASVRTAVLDQDVETMPAGLATEVGARGVRLSGGQVQRTALARALVRKPDLLVLDDVSSALDVETERRLWDRLLANRDRTLLVVSNRPATIARADQVVRLEHGRAVAEQVARSVGCVA
ncbi:ATP-binding cassette domain-containing protein [Tenggerimyces flavus]|uniref:ATP-binding cassette domain-containing protein n=1 Tax=Tenggerimyces flavus TaxID=1708749 RepID=A0ABV7Y766_9ACTN|nr:ABC transporter ATP-binding protein [Tenggerimyces flavus]MBM7784998.1 ATP-binding cassette subfamily B protein [Tenggerimyces flavus]